MIQTHWLQVCIWSKFTPTCNYVHSKLYIQKQKFLFYKIVAIIKHPRYLPTVCLPIHYLHSTEDGYGSKQKCIILLRVILPSMSQRVHFLHIYFALDPGGSACIYDYSDQSEAACATTKTWEYSTSLSLLCLRATFVCCILVIVVWKSRLHELSCSVVCIGCIYLLYMLCMHCTIPLFIPRRYLDYFTTTRTIQLRYESRFTLTLEF